MRGDGDDEFWLELIRKTGSNTAVTAYDDLESLIVSGRLTERDQRRLASAILSLSQLAKSEASRLEHRRKYPHEYSGPDAEGNSAGAQGAPR